MASSRHSSPHSGSHSRSQGSRGKKSWSKGGHLHLVGGSRGSHKRKKIKSHGNVRQKSRMAGLGALVFGTGGVMVAGAVGVGELAVGAFAAYVAYRVIRYGVAPTEAIIEGVQLEHGEVPLSEADIA